MKHFNLFFGSSKGIEILRTVGYSSFSRPDNGDEWIKFSKTIYHFYDFTILSKVSVSEYKMFIFYQF